MKLVVIALFLSATWVAEAQPVADGLYRTSNEASSTSILSQDGKRLALGPAQAVVAGKSRIYSQDNANNAFVVGLAIPVEACADRSSYVLVVSGHAYQSPGSGGGPDFCETDFTFFGAGNAVEMAKYLGIAIEYRRHPGHEFLVSFTPTRSSFHVKDHVTATFRIENVGTNTITFTKGGHYRGASRDNQYTFSARFLDKQVPDIGTSNNFGGIAAPMRLNAGEVFTDTVDLSKWFAFDKKGRYYVLGSYSMDFVIFENLRSIWSDYVSAGFVVTIDQ
jgi:hypothetical protein